MVRRHLSLLLLEPSGRVCLCVCVCVCVCALTHSNILCTSVLLPCHLRFMHCPMEFLMNKCSGRPMSSLFQRRPTSSLLQGRSTPAQPPDEIRSTSCLASTGVPSLPPASCPTHGGVPPSPRAFCPASRGVPSLTQASCLASYGSLPPDRCPDGFFLRQQPHLSALPPGSPLERSRRSVLLQCHLCLFVSAPHLILFISLTRLVIVCFDFTYPSLCLTNDVSPVWFRLCI